ncbi:hypothetical protein [Deefgea sp. CFH1-16]|uniref:O-linked N-acetylglucosamine transferase family protein n=1 Tax=Deefgea sp. CFH1-16 TaxID=2675457 RepID=UPI0015F566EF|nr:hypothetical protein [Deefgea sp. CFH1-16]MBM5575407.1 hypothetical protein [Deefgea sp. CFH1-16]
MGEQQVCTDLIAQFEQLGVTADRLILRSASNRIDYLKTYQEIDIALDPFPLVGGTTTVESLWMGVPVLTLSGATVMSHQGESILRTAGLDDWVAFTQNEYFSRAVAFASDLDGLVMLRAHLRQKIVDSPLCDAPRFAQNLQQVLRSLWQVWCSK